MGESFLTNRLMPMAHAVYFDDLLQSSNNPPPNTDYIITEDGDFITTESGDFLITEN